MMRFEQAIEDYHDEIYRYLYRLCLAAGTAEPTAAAADLTQDTFERAFKAFRRLDPNSNVRAWLYAIAGNRARDFHRRRQSSRRYLLASSPTTSTAAPEVQVQFDQQRQMLYAAMDLLPSKQRQAVRLRYFGELDYQDIAQVLSCSNDSARANVYQGLKKLRKSLGPQWEANNDK